MKKDKIHITLLEQQGKTKSRKSVKAKSNEKLINYNRILGNLQKGWAIENPGKTIPPKLDKEFKTFATNVSGYPSGQRSLPKLNPSFQRYIRLASAPTSKTSSTTPKDLPKILPPPPDGFDPKRFLDGATGALSKKSTSEFDAKAFLKSAPGVPIKKSTSEFDAKDFLKNAPGAPENKKSTSFCNDEDFNDPTGVSLKKAHAKLKGRIYAGIEVPGGGFIDFIDYENVKDLKADANLPIADVAKNHNINTADFKDTLPDASLTMMYNYKGTEYNIIQGTGGDLEVLLCSQEELEQDGQAWTAGAPEDPQGDGSEPDYGPPASGAGSTESSKRNRFYRLAQQVTGVEDKFEAVKVIQRALVDMGLLVHKKGALGSFAVSGLKGVKTDDSFNPFARAEREYGAFQLDGAKNNSARWPIDDKKYMIDGIPGERTRTAVSVFQVFCLSLGFDLGTTGPKKDGVDGIVGDKTWAAMVAQKNQGNIKSLKAIESWRPNDPETTGPETAAASGAATPTIPVQSPRTQQPPQAPTVGNIDPDNIFNWYTGIDFFDQNFLLAVRRGNILKMTSKSGNIALETKPDSAFADKNPLLYDAYLLYENLDGLGTDNEAQITRIISKYSLPIDKFIKDAHEGLGIEDTAKALANSDEWFNKINMTGFGLFSSFSQAYFTGHAIYYAYNGRLVLEKDTSSGGLIKWLIDDGMDKEAQMLKQRIKAERHVASELNRILTSSEEVPDDSSTAREFLIKTIRRAAAIQNSNISKSNLPKTGSGQDTQQEPPGGFGPNFVRDRETRRLRPSRPGEG